MTNDTTAVPEGYLRDAQGRLVPIDRVRPIDRERDQLVNELVRKAKVVHKEIADLKDRAFGDIHAFIELSAEQYGAKLGARKGNVTLTSFDGRYKILRAMQDRITFDERLQAARALLDECASDWSSAARSEVQAVIAWVFETDKEGNLSVGRILTLRRMAIEDERWQRAMQAVSDSVQVVGSKSYLRFYERVGDTDEWRSINLDIAGA